LSCSSIIAFFGIAHLLQVVSQAVGLLLVEPAHRLT
jgi:hypothetical protein